MGSALGWLVAIPLICAAVRFAPATVPRLDEVRLGGTATLFVLAVTVAVAALLTAAPFATIARARSTDEGALSGARRGAIGDRWTQRVRNGMVVAEISAALVLVLATIVLVGNLRRLQALAPGFRPDGVFQARVSIPPSYRSAEEVSRFDDRVTERLASAPGVRQAGVISVAPLSGLLYTVPFSVAGQPAEPDRPSANLRAVSPGYLPAVGTRILRGRPFSDTDAPHAPPVALVSDALAERFLSGDGIGRQLLIDDNDEGPRPVEVVGVVENVRHAALDLPPAFDVYIPLGQMHPDGVPSLRSNQFWMVRTGSDPAAFRETFLAHLRAVDADAAVSDTGTMRQFLDASLGPRRFSLGLFGAFASTAVLLAVLGLYGLVSYTVSQRAAEIGVRMAIGATRGDVQRMILRQAAKLGLAGTVSGAVLAVALRTLTSRFVTGIRLDPLAAAITAAALLLVVLLAAWLPARRAARIPPTEALRAGPTSP
jgi:putative ABC transport system permease protein